MSRDLERAGAILAADREKLSLLHRPLHTAALFLSYSAHRTAYYTEAALSKPLVNTVLLPLVVALCFISYNVIPAPASSIFAALDADGDGYATTSEVESYYTTVLKQPAETGTAAARSFGAPSVEFDAFAEWWQSTTPEVQRYRAVFAHGWWREVEYWLADALYWVVLGVLSSIGLGTGMHSGLLFLFPHIYLTCAAVSRCGNTNFWSYPSNLFYGPRDRLFVCLAPQSQPEAAALQVSLLQYLLKVVPACVLWGAGTAIGEVPPYALSYAAALQGRHRDDLQETPAYDVMTLMKNWTLRKIRRYGFWAILLLAAWPNMAFDLCGMACGQFLMPFWTFFSATFIGKALIKVNMQAIFFIVLFSGDNIERLMRKIGHAAAGVLPASLRVGAVVEQAVGAVVQARNSIANRAKGDDGSVLESAAESTDSLVVWVLHWVVVAAVAWFAKSIVESFAYSEQERRDEGTLSEMAMALRRRHESSLPISSVELRAMLLSAEADAQDGESSVIESVMCFTRLALLAAVGLITWGVYHRHGSSISLGLTLLLHRYLDRQLTANAASQRKLRMTLRVALGVAVLCIYA
ncbi:hypothetical protein ABB37_01766 [Leptomonas pyrrhocoris]|uniref:VTT domain-containing protein n=1 Tax=Leptomonas pyrrhocoris TaxID=157538 RepID=A0A0N0VHH9_LEPPY|nr:hypothetical protein ABB37_01766 [Leptomonas pyrrhocoris]KPA85474.1 hypothetical protein ABB37_01766 [Leptomonas pyrrhocoris]|eukprot:XP_015663913.1 hypothetical protein ABB37_01766 [Leptomonas pyrrhocoris]